MENYGPLKQKAMELGADLFGVSQTSLLASTITDEIKGVAEKLPYSISIAVRLQQSVFDTLTDGPNLVYKAHYRQANNLLDKIAFQLGQHIQSDGYHAMPIPASVITDWARQRGHLSHRHAAVNCGIGFFGKSGLVVHPRYGAAIRLATILTDMPVATDSPLEPDCGDCYRCVEACPAHAISPEGMAFFDGQSCHDMLKLFEKRRGIGLMICGLCIKACRGI